MIHAFESEGRLWRRNALTEVDLCVLEQGLNINNITGNRLKPSDISNQSKTILNKIDNLAKEVMKGAQAVRLTSFNKTADANWVLPWHQDRVIAVENKFEKIGFDNWSKKVGVWHCEPPTEILNQMMFARVHLNDSNQMNGCFEVSLGSHTLGKVISNEIPNVVTKLKSEKCVAKRGDILFSKALILHRSLASSSTSPRLALRIDYANQCLPAPLSWYF